MAGGTDVPRGSEGPAAVGKPGRHTRRRCRRADRGRAVGARHPVEVRSRPSRAWPRHRGLHSRIRARARGHAGSWATHDARALRQARSAGGAPFRGNPLRHAIAIAPRHAGSDPAGGGGRMRRRGADDGADPCRGSRQRSGHLDARSRGALHRRPVRAGAATLPGDEPRGADPAPRRGAATPRCRRGRRGGRHDDSRAAARHLRRGRRPDRRAGRPVRHRRNRHGGTRAGHRATARRRRAIWDSSLRVRRARRRPKRRCAAPMASCASPFARGCRCARVS